MIPSQSLLSCSMYGVMACATYNSLDNKSFWFSSCTRPPCWNKKWSSHLKIVLCCLLIVFRKCIKFQKINNLKSVSTLCSKFKDQWWKKATKISFKCEKSALHFNSAVYSTGLYKGWKLFYWLSCYHFLLPSSDGCLDTFICCLVCLSNDLGCTIVGLIQIGEAVWTF